MASINKHREIGLIACALTKRLCPESEGLLKFVYYGACCDQIAHRTKPRIFAGGGTIEFFPNLFKDVLKKEGVDIDRSNLTRLGKSILEEVSKEDGVDKDHAKSFITEVLMDALEEEIRKQTLVQL